MSGETFETAKVLTSKSGRTMKKIITLMKACLLTVTASTAAYAENILNCSLETKIGETIYSLHFSQARCQTTSYISGTTLPILLRHPKDQTTSAASGWKINVFQRAIEQQEQSAHAVELTQAQLNDIKKLTANKQYPKMYLYLKILVDKWGALITSASHKENLSALSIWLERASDVNFNSGSWSSEMARGSLAFAAATKGKSLSEDAFQEASDAQAENITRLILQRGALPTLKEIIALEVQSTVYAFHLDEWNWPGTLTDSLPIQVGGLGRDLVQVPGSGVSYQKNITVAVMQYAAGLNRYLWSFTELDTLPLWRYAKELQLYASENTFELFQWLGADEEAPQQNKPLKISSTCKLRDVRDRTLYRLNLSSTGCRTISYVSGNVIPILLSYPKIEVVDSSWRGTRLSLRLYYTPEGYDIERALTHATPIKIENGVSTFNILNNEHFVFRGTDAALVTIKSMGGTWLAQRKQSSELVIIYQFPKTLGDFRAIDELVKKFAEDLLDVKD